MPDGISGLSMSEMGISNAKKTANAVKKAVNPFVQGAASQLTGQQPKPQMPAGVKPPSGAQPPSETMGGQTSNSFDITGLFQDIKKQVTGSGGGSTTLTPGVATPIKSPTASQPPSETSPKQGGGFDLSSFGGGLGAGDESLFDMTKPPPLMQKSPLQQSKQQDIESTFAKQKQEDQQKIEALRKRLHDMYYEDFSNKAEGKNKKEETVQEKLEKEEQEKQQKQMEEQKKEEKMQPIVPSSILGRQGAHEGLKKLG